jgi:hypothetical protein
MRIRGEDKCEARMRISWWHWDDNIMCVKCAQCIRVSPHSKAHTVGHEIGFQAQCTSHPYSIIAFSHIFGHLTDAQIIID